MEHRVKCEAHARTTGLPCQAKALANGRCKLHGGLSTGPRTDTGRASIAQATSFRMATGQQAKALAGYSAWLERGGSKVLSKKAKVQNYKK